MNGADSSPWTASGVDHHLLTQPAVPGDSPMYLATAARMGWPAFVTWVNQANEMRGITPAPNHRDETTGGGQS